MYRRFTIQPSEKRLFNRQGFLVKERFISDEKIRQAAGYCQPLIRQNPGVQKTQPCIIAGLPTLQPELISLLASLDIWKATQTLLGTPRLVYHYSQLIIKPPHSNSEVNWHRDFDNPYISPVHSDFLRVFIPLSDMTEKNGTPQLIAGSNHIADTAVRLSHQKHIKQLGENLILTCFSGL